MLPIMSHIPSIHHVAPASAHGRTFAAAAASRVTKKRPLKKRPMKKAHYK